MPGSKSTSTGEVTSVNRMIAITMGDPAGIGPEIVIKALCREEVRNACLPLVIGSPEVLKQDMAILPPVYRRAKLNVLQEVRDASCEPGVINVIDPMPLKSEILKGRVSPEAGAAAVAYLTLAIHLAKEGLVSGIVTAPLNKQAMHLGGCLYPGHTELLAELFGVSRYCMVLNHEQLSVLHVTTHIALSKVPSAITVDRVLEKIRIAAALADCLDRTEKPIAVAGLNPHAGEHGLFGTEEVEVIEPAVEKARAQGINVVGPLPADALFPKAAAGEYDFVVAMYHDQGHIPFKTLHFDEGVNITVGLPVVRTSVDHGTAFDIAGKGVAKEKSMLQAILVAARLAGRWDQINQRLNHNE